MARFIRSLLLLTLLLPVPTAWAADEPAAQPAAGRRVLAYYVPYDPGSWTVLQQQVRTIDLVAAQWVAIDACGNLASRDDQTIKQFARANGIGIVPSLLTLSGWLNHRLLTDEATTAQAIQQIVAYVDAEGYDGFDLDLEGVAPADRPAYSAFVAALASALHARGKGLSLALAPKTSDTTTGWAGAFDYATLAGHADLISIMAYEFRGPFSGPGSVAPYDWVERVLAFATSQIPAEKVLLGLAFYGYDWNVTTGTARALGYGLAARLAERYQIPIGFDPVSRSATFRYQAPAGEVLPAAPPQPPLQHEITVREAPPCTVPAPTATPRPSPRPAPPPDAIHQHEVWLEESGSTAARLGLADRYQVGGVMIWRPGLDDPRVWEILQQWRAGRS